MSPLRTKFDDFMKLRRFTPSTRQSYLEAIAKVSTHYSKSPEKISEEEIHQYILYMDQVKGLSYSSCNVFISAARCFYNQCFGQGKALVLIPSRKSPKRLPQVLTVEQVQRLIRTVENPKHRTILMTIYRGGLRLIETRQLKIKDILSDQGLIHVRHTRNATLYYLRLY